MLNSPFLAAVRARVAEDDAMPGLIKDIRMLPDRMAIEDRRDLLSLIDRMGEALENMRWRVCEHQAAGLGTCEQELAMGDWCPGCSAREILHSLQAEGRKA